MRRFAMIKRDAETFTIQIKDANDFRRWPYRDDYLRYTSRDAAEIAAEQRGLILVKRWCDANLTKDEEKASGY
jgi:hypothetical protein